MFQLGNLHLYRNTHFTEIFGKIHSQNTVSSLRINRGGHHSLGTVRVGGYREVMRQCSTAIRILILIKELKSFRFMIM